jgi:hypothetical protein
MKTLFTNRTMQMALFGIVMAFAVMGGMLAPDVAMAVAFAGTTLADTHPTLLDVTKRMDPEGKIDAIAEMLHQRNEILDDMVFIEGNLPTGHRTTVRTGLPAPTWRKLYGGVQPTKSTTRQVTEACGMLEAYAEVDKALADLNGNTAAFRMSEEFAHIEGMNQEFASTLIYGNEATEPEAITGFAPRFNDQSALNGENIITSAATPDGTDNTSIWLVVWGPNTVHGIYPKGSKAGLQHEDKGQITIESIDGAGGRMEAYRSHYRWDVGLCVRDWRYVVRINFDHENLTFDAATGPDLTDLMVQAMELVPSLQMGRPAFYMNRSTKTWLRRQIVNKTKASTLSQDNIAGKHVMYFDGIPCRRVDSILLNEAGI